MVGGGGQLLVRVPTPPCHPVSARGRCAQTEGWKERPARALGRPCLPPISWWASGACPLLPLPFPWGCGLAVLETASEARTGLAEDLWGDPSPLSLTVCASRPGRAQPQPGANTEPLPSCRSPFLGSPLLGDPPTATAAPNWPHSPLTHARSGCAVGTQDRDGRGEGQEPSRPHQGSRPLGL